jgi:peptidoglycan/LPS O-acetylase OafA/YrhL
MNWPPVVYVGTISYSLYLWQELFFTRYKVTPLTTFPLNILAVVLCAVLSYHFVELQFLRLKRRFEV